MDWNLAVHYYADMHDPDFFMRKANLLREGRPFATARLVDVQGSVPQRPGAAMLVFPDGAIERTVGGGRFEAQVILDALELLEKREAIAVREYAINREELGMYCAGKARVLLETHPPTAELVIFGGGHVGQALGRLAAEIAGLRTAVVDDRARYADPTLHPQADRVIHTDALYQEGLPGLGAWTYAVIVTRCHGVDKAICRRLVDEDLAYLGMIGSRTKAKTLLGELRDEGVPDAHLARIRTPIGLALGDTKEPGEVALSILAEVVKKRNESKEQSA